jgi:hypothetical protein
MTVSLELSPPGKARMSRASINGILGNHGSSVWSWSLLDAGQKGASEAASEVSILNWLTATEQLNN